ncbi:MAG: M23 family metallopeptidase [Desulfovibrio sp.]|nr:M23 family metallopeptidase [Desulfovibrio sp.]
MRRRSIFPGMLTVVLLVVLGAIAFSFLKDMDGPTIVIAPATGKVSAASVLRIELDDPSGIRSITAGVRKNNVFSPLYSRHYDSYDLHRVVELSFRDANLREGAFDLEIRATDGSMAGFGQGNTRTLQIPMRYDLQPPRISVKTLPPHIRRGGSAVVRYGVDEEVSESGILIQGYFVPGFLQQDGSYVCFFPFPYTMTAKDFKSSVEIMATDLAGNVTRSRLTVVTLERVFKNDTLEVNESFLNAVQTKLGNLAPDAPTPLDCFLKINNDVRAENAAFLRDIGRNTVSGMLWGGAFQRLPRSASKAGFADHRFYTYQGKTIAESYHLGLDLASLRNAEVPAANNGRVVFVGNLGIYGNIVVVDHGLGVMSLYSHLSEPLVQEGAAVMKGQTIGRTGTTGLAFGDHLHFGMLVGGVEVTPLEWIDAKWIHDNVILRVTDQPS